MKTHWKKTIDKDWIGTYILPEGKPINVKLISVKLQNVKVKGVSGDYKVAYFDKNEYFDKPMLLSASTNLKRIEVLTGTPYIEDWNNLNLWVTLQQEMDKTFGGGKDWALRIGSIAPQIKTIKDFPSEEKQLKDCKNIEELKFIYGGLSKELKTLFTALKDELKNTYNDN